MAYGNDEQHGLKACHAEKDVASCIDFPCHDTSVGLGKFREIAKVTPVSSFPRQGGNVWKGAMPVGWTLIPLEINLGMHHQHWPTPSRFG